MTDRSRTRLSAWFDTDDLDQVRRYADQESDGNLSLMLRLLVREALATRNRRSPRKAPTQ